MPIEIVIPRLGWNMDEGIFAGWLKEDGEPVLVGDPLFRLEAEKATQDIEAFDHGILRIPANAPAVGDTVAVGAVIGYLLQPGEPDPSEASPSRGGTGGLSAREVTTAPGGTGGLPAREIIRADTGGQAARATQHTADSGAQAVPATPRTTRPTSSPLARRLARELGVDWTRLAGSGRTGRVRKADVLAAAEARTAPRKPDDTTATVPLSPTRRTIAARLVEGLRTTVPVTLTTTVDATNLVNLRGQFQAVEPEGRVAPSYTDLVVKLTALALREHPHLNARWGDDRLILADDIHVGIAVDTDAGLVVPVIRSAASLGLRQVAVRARDLIRRAREQRLQPSEMQGGTFTVTNLGALGIETFTPIINPPECAILGMGRIERQPVMIGDQVVGRERMSLSLTFDHRIVDGAPAARFLQHLGRLIENPGPWLVS